MVFQIKVRRRRRGSHRQSDEEMSCASRNQNQLLLSCIQRLTDLQTIHSDVRIHEGARAAQATNRKRLESGSHVSMETAEAIKGADPQRQTVRLQPGAWCQHKAASPGGAGVPFAVHHRGGATAGVDVSSCVPAADDTRQRKHAETACGTLRQWICTVSDSRLNFLKSHQSHQFNHQTARPQ